MVPLWYCDKNILTVRFFREQKYYSFMLLFSRTFLLHLDIRYLSKITIIQIQIIGTLSTEQVFQKFWLQFFLILFFLHRVQIILELETETHLPYIIDNLKEISLHSLLHLLFINVNHTQCCESLFTFSYTQLHNAHKHQDGDFIQAPHRDRKSRFRPPFTSFSDL